MKDPNVVPKKKKHQVINDDYYDDEYYGEEYYDEEVEPKMRMSKKNKAKGPTDSLYRT